MADGDAVLRENIAKLVRRVAAQVPEEVLSDLQCPQCGSMLSDPWTLGSGRTVCKACLTRVTGEHVQPVANRLLAFIVQHCLPQASEAASHRLKGNDHFKQGNWQLAIDEYTEALQIDGRSPAAFANRSFAHLKLQLKDDAIKDAQDAVGLRPLWPKWHLRLAQSLRAAQRSAEAVTPLLHAAALELVQMELAPGSVVEIHSLQSTSDYNGQMGKCIRWHRDRSRWEVRLQNGNSIKVKPQNLELVYAGATPSTSTRSEVFSLMQEGHTLPSLECLGFPSLPTPVQIPVEKMKGFREELDCCMCSSLLCEPAVLPCGHCMCRDCVARLLDHALQSSPCCPLCRADLKPMLQQINRRARAEQRGGLRFAHGAAQLTVCSALDKLLSAHFPDEYEERLSEVRAPQSEWVPIFVCSLSAPFIPTPLHIFEPRYRLMMRRCVESNQRFGMCLPSDDGNDFADTGTMLFIDRFEQLPDGRSLIGTKGVSRFQVIERSTLDGYSTALIRPFDEDTEGFPGSSTFHREALALHRGAQTFLNKVGQSDALENLERQLGPLPDVDSPQFDAHMSFYAAQLIVQLTHNDDPDIVFLQPEHERWQKLLQACTIFPPFADELKALSDECQAGGDAGEDEPMSP